MAETANTESQPEKTAMPVTVRVETPTGLILPIKNLGEADVFINLRECLATTPEACHFTCYGLQIVQDDEATGKPINDFAQLSEFPEVISGKAHVRMITKFYKLRDVRQHVCRFRKILANPPTQPTSQSNKSDVPENKTADSSQPKTASSKESDATTKNSKVKAAAKQKTPKVIIHKSPAGPVVLLSKEMLKQQANRRKKKVAQLKLDVQLPVPTNPEDILSISYSYMQSGTSSESAYAESQRRSCVHSICFSGFNPPPQQRRIVGDLQYLEIKVLEGTTFHVTACSAGFFVNSTRNDRFNPSPALYAYHSQTLFELLSKASPKFLKHYEALAQRISESCPQNTQDLGFLCSPWKTVTSLYQCEPRPTWLGGNSPPHTHDLNRAEDHLRGVGYVGDDEVAEQMRDWNDDYQACREMPTKTLNERVVRHRALHKTVSDFVAMAKKGASAVLQGDVPPINPVDEEKRHIYILNNIFYSLALDTRGTYTGEGEERVAHKLAKMDLVSIKEVNKLDNPGLCTLMTVVLDYLGHRVVAQSIIPGIFQVSKACRLTYGSIDRGNTIHVNNDMHAIMKTTMERLGLRSSCVVARNNENEGEAPPAGINSHVEDRAGTDPVTFYGPVECKGILGSDGRAYVLDLVRITPKDLNFADATYLDNFTAVLRPELLWMYNKYRAQKHNLKQSLDAKAKADADAKAKADAKPNSDSKEVTSTPTSADETTEEATDKPTDLPAKEPTDPVVKEPTETKPPTPAEESKTEPAVPTLVNAADTPDAVGKAGTGAAEQVAVGEAEIESGTNKPTSEGQKTTYENIKFDVNVFTEHTLGLEPEEVKAREADVLALCKFVRTNAIPALVTDINRGITACIDGEALVKAMHSHGINVRYLGEVATLMSRKCLKHTVAYICEIEMITRGLKEYTWEVFQKSPELMCAPGPFIIHVLNCLLGFKPQGTVAVDAGGGNPEPVSPDSKRKTSVSPSQELAIKALTELAPLTSPALWALVKQKVKSKYRHDLVLVDYGLEEPKGALLRLQLLRRVCQKLGVVMRARNYDMSGKESLQLSDLLDMVPVTKTCIGDVPLNEAHKHLDLGRLFMATGNFQRAYFFVEQALMQLYQVCGAESKETLRGYQLLAAILSRAGDSTAVLQQQRAAALSERLLGLDNQETAEAIGTLALLQKAFGDPASAVSNFRKSIRLMDLAGGPTNHEAGVLYKQMGAVYQEAGHYKLAIKCFHETLKRHSADARSRATVLKLVAECCNRDGAHNEACKAERHCKQLLEQLFGPQSTQVQEANKRLKQFTQDLVSKTRLANAKADAMKVKQLENKKKTKRTRRRKRKKTK